MNSQAVAGWHINYHSQIKYILSEHLLSTILSTGVMLTCENKKKKKFKTNKREVKGRKRVSQGAELTSLAVLVAPLPAVFQ